MITLTEIKKRAELATSDILSKEDENTAKVNPKLVFENPLLSILKKPNNIIPFVSSDEFESLIAFNLIISTCENQQKLKSIPKKESRIENVIEKNKIISKRNLENRFLLDDMFSLEKLSLNIDLKSDRIEEKLIKALSIVTTHPAKHNETNDKLDFSFSTKKDLSITYGISGVNLKSEVEPLTVSGNAGDFGSRYIFLLRFVLDGKKTSVIEMLADNHPMIITAFEKSGMRLEFISELCEIAKNLVDNDFPDNVVGNQVFWETGDEYTLISPIPSVQMISEQKAIQEKYAADKRLGVKLKSKALGGSKGQNLSQINSQIPNAIFFSDLSFLNKKIGKLERKLHLDTIPSLLKHAFLTKEEIAKLNRPLHTKAIPSHNRLVSLLLFRMLDDLIIAKDSEMDFDNKLFSSHKEKKFLVGITNLDDYIEFDSYVYKHYLKEMNFYNVEVVSDNIKVREIKRVISKVVRSL